MLFVSHATLDSSRKSEGARLRGGKSERKSPRVTHFWPVLPEVGILTFCAPRVSTSTSASPAHPTCTSRGRARSGSDSPCNTAHPASPPAIHRQTCRTQHSAL